MKKIKQVLYIAMLIDFVIVFITGLSLKIFHHGGNGFRRASNEFSQRHLWCDIHFIASMLLIILLGYHLWLCRKPLVKLIKA
jgi:succinate dehydrogenase/fumarate reductase cytochrome b subunit